MPTGRLGRTGFDSGIYAIVCRVNTRKYYGSTYNFVARKAQHWSDLRHNRHRNIHLQRAWNKHTEAAFDFIVVERVPVDQLLEAENRYLKFGHYNLFRDAERPTTIAPVDRVCKECGLKFQSTPAIVKSGRHKFCSMACYQADHQRYRKESHICKICGERFRVYKHRVADGRGNYCSKKCWNVRAGGRREIACQQCGKPFLVSGNSRRKYCSHECYSRGKMKREERACQQCGAILYPYSRNAAHTYCSRKCYYDSRKLGKEVKIPRVPARRKKISHE